MRRDYVASTSIRRHFGTKCPLGYLYKRQPTITKPARQITKCYVLTQNDSASRVVGPIRLCKRKQLTDRAKKCNYFGSFFFKAKYSTDDPKNAYEGPWPQFRGLREFPQGANRTNNHLHSESLTRGFIHCFWMHCWSLVADF